MPAGRPKKSEFLALYAHACHFYWEFKGIHESQDTPARSRRVSADGTPVWIPGEPEIIDKLLKATSPLRIRKLCANAFGLPHKYKDRYGNVLFVPQPIWPISSESQLPKFLSDHAAQFIEARKDRRFPKSGRPSSRLKQLWFLSQALAGAAQGMATRTAINQLGSVRPDEPDKISKFIKRTRTPRA